MNVGRDNSISTENVILEVKARPCLWDTSHELYKNREAKQNAWLEITRKVIPNFDNLDEGDKAKAAEKIQSRWKHSRDCYGRMSKNNPSLIDKKNKSYMYYNHLKFLNKNYEPRIINRWRFVTKPDEIQNESSNVASERSAVDDSDTEEDEEILPKEKKRKLTTDDELKDQLLLMMKNSSKNTNDDDTAFFNSLLPAVRELNTLEKLTFRSKVIHELINIKREK